MAQAHAVVLLERAEEIDELRAMEAEMDEPVEVGADEIDEMLKEMSRGRKSVLKKPAFDTEDFT